MAVIMMDHSPAGAESVPGSAAGITPTAHNPIPSDKQANKTIRRLYWKLWKASWKGNTQQWMQAIIVLLYGIGGAIGFVVFGLIIADEAKALTTNVPGAHAIGASAPPIIADAPWSTAAATGGILLLMIMVMWPSGENAVPPENLATYPIKESSIVRALLPTIFCNSRAFIAFIVTAGTMGGAIAACVIAGSYALIPIAVVGYVLGVISLLFTCAAASAVLGSGGSRSKREKLTLYMSMGFVFLLILFRFAMNSAGSLSHSRYVEWAVRVVCWTPIASGPALLEDAARGMWIILILRLLVTFAALYLMVKAWKFTVRTQLSLAAMSDGGATKVKTKDSFYLPFVPRTVSGAIFKRQIKYWKRDLRFKYSLLTTPLMVILFLIIGIVGHNYGLIFGACFVVIISAGSLTANDFGYDGPSNWMHMVAGVSGKDIVKARLGVNALYLIPLFVIFITAVALCFDIDKIGVGLLGAAFAVVTCGAAQAIMMSVLNPFPAPKPGSNPMKGGRGQASNAYLLMLTTVVFVILPTLPALLLPLLGSVWQWVSLTYGIIVGAAILAFASRFTARRIDQRYPEIFAKIRHWSD